MSDYEAEYAKYSKDSRIACRYGVKCYQKNPTHHEKYKHPPKRNNNSSSKQAAKKMKVQDKNGTKAVTVDTKVNNDVSSDSDETDVEKILKESQKSDHSDSENDIIEATPEKNEKTSSNSKSEEKQVVKMTPKQVNVKEFIKEKFLVDMPDDFYQFWTLCERLNKNNPTEAFKSVGLKLVGPYDVLAGKFNNVPEKTEEEYLIHWRYYYDIPEFQTVLKGDDQTGFHIGYFRDEPDKPPVFMASNYGTKEGIISSMGSNIFAAVFIYLEELKKSGDPFKKMNVPKFQGTIKSEAEKLDLNLAAKTDKMRQRALKVVTRTFNKIGLVVPYNRKTQLGYRELAMGDKDLNTLLTKIKNASPEQMKKLLSELQPVLTFASIAADECDFGTGLELGWNIMCHGVDSLNATALRFLTSSYSLLKREAFTQIAAAHVKNRRKGCNLSIL